MYTLLHREGIMVRKYIQLLGWIGAIQKDLKSIVLPEFVYDCLSGTTRNQQSTDDTVQER